MSSRLGFLAAAAILTLLTAIDPAQPAETSIPSRIRDAGKLVFCTELAFPPWEMLDAQTQQPTGFDIDFAAAVAKQMGIKSEHKNIAFDGLIPALQAGQCDAIISGLYASLPVARSSTSCIMLSPEIQSS